MNKFKLSILSLFLALCSAQLTIPLNKTASGYSISVQLPDSSNGNLLIALYTPNIVLFNSSSPLNFSTFPATLSFCESSADPFPVCSQELFNSSYPYFDATGNALFTLEDPVTLPLDDDTTSVMFYEMLISTNVTSNASFGQGNYGLFGLGRSNVKTFTYPNLPNQLSLYLNTSSDGTILIGTPDLTYAASNTTVSQAFDVDSETWEISHVNLFVFSINGSPMYHFQVEQSVIFDINSDAIGLPLNLYNLFLIVMKNYGLTDCVASTNAVTCSYSGSLSALPTVTLLGKNGTEIILPPQLYLNNKGPTSQEILLNVKGVDPALQGRYYVDPSYNTFIILDSTFMSYYYTVFDWDSNTINFYLSLGEQPLQPVSISDNWTFNTSNSSANSNTSIEYWSCLQNTAIFGDPSNTCAPLDPIVINTTATEPNIIFVSFTLQNISECNGYPLEQNGTVAFSPSSSSFQVGNFSFFYLPDYDQPQPLTDFSDLSDFNVAGFYYQKRTYYPFNWTGTFTLNGVTNEKDTCLPQQFSCYKSANEDSFYYCQWNWPLENYYCELLNVFGNWTTKSFYPLDVVCLTYPEGCLYLNVSNSNPDLLLVYTGLPNLEINYTRSSFGLLLETASFIISLVACFIL
ncbi:MAG: pepsin-like aspartyl protease [Bacteroidia bacterium]